MSLPLAHDKMILINESRGNENKDWSGLVTIHKKDQNRSLILNQLTSLLELPFEFQYKKKFEIPKKYKKIEPLYQHQNFNDFSDCGLLFNTVDTGTLQEHR